MSTTLPSEQPGAAHEPIDDRGQPVDHGASERYEDGDKRLTSAKQVAANQRNAQRSTGPRSDAGKARSAFNAMTHGVYSRAHPIERGVLAENAEEVAKFIDGLIDDLEPRDSHELALARRIAEGELRLARTDRYENVGLNAAGRLSRYEVTQGLGQDVPFENMRDRCFDASLVVTGVRAPAEDGAWIEVAELLWMLKGVPHDKRDMPKAGDDLVAANAAEKKFLYEVLIPRYWKSYKGASLALRQKADEFTETLFDTAGVAEERAVEKAFAPGGVMDRASLLRSRTRRDLERDRATFEKLQQRDLGWEHDDEEA